MSDLVFYGGLLAEIKDRIRQAQTRAALSANAEMIAMYWDIGRMIHKRQRAEGWGAGVIPRLAGDLKNELPEVKGFSERNIKRMLRFYREYQDLPQPVTNLVPQVAAFLHATDDQSESIVPQSAAQLPTFAPPLAFGIPWFHHVILIEKVRDLSTRLWYMQQTIEQGWGRDTLTAMIKGRAHDRQGQAISNFASRLPAPQSELARQLLKDPYLFDFLTLEEPFHERELETGLVRHNVSGNPVAIEKACDEIAVGALERARKVISEQYPFFPPSNAGRQYSDYQKTKIFLRDGFIDRYSGDKLVFPAVLRLLSCLMPEEFPFHKNWKTSECHLAYWQLLPTVDHVVPVSRGGSDRESNWVCTSQLRNSAKSNWLLEELGWKLHEPGRVDDWDGMVHWYVEYIGQHAEFLEDKYLSSWYRAAKNAIET